MATTGRAAEDSAGTTSLLSSRGSLRKFANHVRALSDSSNALISKVGTKVSTVALLRLMSADKRLSKSLSDLGVMSRTRECGVRPSGSEVCASDSGLCACKGRPWSRVNWEPQVILDQLMATLSRSQSSSSKASEVESFYPPPPSSSSRTTSSSRDNASSVSLEGDRQPPLPDMDLESQVEEEVEEEDSRGDRGGSRRKRKAFLRICRRIVRGLRRFLATVVLGGSPSAEDFEYSSALPCYECAVRHQGTRGCSHTRNQPDVVNLSAEEAQSVLNMLAPAVGAGEVPPPYGLHRFFSADVDNHAVPTFQVPRSIVQLHALRYELDLDVGYGCKRSFCCAGFGAYIVMLIICWIIFLL
ncbi:uncharacterized protein LOC143033241 [Oratosquilla oratoria]|uniref:uncharacterized protein LOC143033241 n=1 Tax=Oratosquilla oratoria TaxID=337810 RepID=UPI003F77724F